MRLKSSLVALFLLLQTAVSLAQEIYRLEANDQFELWTSIEPSLRRTVTIQPDGWVSLPLAGYIKASGLTVPELEKLLQDKLKGFFKQPLDLTVMLQPNTELPQMIYITGEVTNPGSYQYRAGMLVLHGISMAGGLYRPSVTSADEDRQLVIKREMRLQTARLAALSSQIARINAEIAGADQIIGVDTASAELQREQEIFESRRAEQAVQEQSRAKAAELRMRSVDALKSQSESVNERIKLAERRLGQINKLVSQGYAHEAQRLEVESDLASLHGERHQLDLQIAIANLDFASELARFDLLARGRRNALLLELREAEREQAAVRSTLGDNEKILEVYDAAEAGNQAQQRIVALSVVRSVDGRPVEAPATELSSIQAGDLIRVTRVGPSVPAATLSTSSNAHLPLQLPQVE